MTDLMGRITGRMTAQARGYLVSAVFHACAFAAMAGLASGTGQRGSRLLSLDISISRHSASQVQTVAPRRQSAVQKKEPVVQSKEPVAPKASVAPEPVMEQAAQESNPQESLMQAAAEPDTSASGSEASAVPDGGFRIDLSGLREHVQRSITYPPLARRMGWEGKVVVAFTICADGSIKDIRIVESSGKAILDSNALDVVKRIDRFPTGGLNTGAGESVVLPIVYKLDG